jgi:hypothetical protein
MAHCIHNAASGREETMPHTIARAPAARRVLIVGAGPAGLEAARVAGERGPEVVVHEAADQPGGQVRLTALIPRKREMAGIIDWRMAQCAALGVRFYFNSLADEAMVVHEVPQVVVIATGGLPHTAVLATGNALLVSAWDILSGDVCPGTNVLVHDDAGDHAGLMAAEKIAATGARVEIVSPDRSLAPEVMGMNLVPYMRALQKLDCTFTVSWRLLAVRRAGNGLEAELGSDWGPTRQLRAVNQVVVNHGIRPLDELYFALKPLSRNLGALDHAALLAGRAQALNPNPEGRFQLFRIGDAVAARNTHAAIYDALRLMKDI